MENNNSLLIKGGKIITMAGKIYDKGDILVEDGKIMDIREEIKVNCKVIDASGLTVIPGFIECHSHIGIEEPSGENIGNLNETSSPTTPYIKGLDGVNFYDESFQKALKNGITTIATGPGSANVIGGSFCVLKTFGESPFVRIVKEKSSMKAAFGETPKRIYSQKGKSPVTKMGIAYILREYLEKTKDYMEKKEIKEAKKEYFEKNTGYEEMIPVLKGLIPLSLHVHRGDDIVTALRIAESYNIKLQLLHVTEGEKLLNEIKERDIPCILGPVMSTSKRAETREKSPRLAMEFSNNNILTAISTDHPVTPIEYLPLSAGLCVKNGMGYIKALEAVTINPAKILGIDRKIGSIEVGKDGDIVIIDGDPLEVMSKVKWVIGKGKIVFEEK